MKSYTCSGGRLPLIAALIALAALGVLAIRQPATAGSCSTFNLGTLHGDVDRFGRLDDGDCISQHSGHRRWADVYTFSLPSTQRIEITMTSSDISPMLAVVTPSGRVVRDDDDGGVTRLAGSASAGRYLIEATKRDVQPGSYRMRITFLAPEFATRSSCPVQQLGTLNGTIERSGRLANGDCIAEHTGRRRWADRYEFSLTQSRRVTIDLRSSDIDPMLALVDSQGRRIDLDDDGGDGRNARIVRQLSPGRYRIEATKYDSPAGSYRLQIVPEVSLDDPNVRRRIAETYMPILFLHGDEEYEPVGVEAMLDHAAFHCSPETSVRGPISSETLARTPCQWGSWLDIAQRHLRHDSWWSDVKEEYDNVVYYRVAETGDWLTVQYWLFFVFNDAPGGRDFDHEGDWESVQLWFGKHDTGVTSLIRGAIPVQVGYASHERGAYHVWSDLQKEGRRPHVYVAEGTHASYPSSGDWRLNLVGEGWADCRIWPQDHTEAGRRLDEYEVRDLAEADWLLWQGRWGDVGDEVLADGPTGPLYKDHWHVPPSQLVSRSEHSWVTSIPRCWQ